MYPECFLDGLEQSGSILLVIVIGDIDDNLGDLIFKHGYTPFRIRAFAPLREFHRFQHRPSPQIRTLLL